MNDKKIAILINSYSRFVPFAQKYLEILKFNQINYEILNLDDADFWHKVIEFDYFIYIFPHTHTEKKLGKNLILLLNTVHNIPCFPSYNEIWHYDEKVVQSFLFQSTGFGQVPTKIFFDHNRAIKWIKNSAQFPLVFKLSSGAGSRDVVLVKNRRHALGITTRMFTTGLHPGKVPIPFIWKLNRLNVARSIEERLRAYYRLIRGREFNEYYEKQTGYVLFQEYLPDNEFDTRINIIGNRAFGFRRFNRPKDFRASGSGLIDYDHTNVSLECVKAAFGISQKFGFRNMAYDFLFDRTGKPVVCEMTYIYSDIAVYNCPGYWDIDMRWHFGHFWPQYFQLSDLLNCKALKQPQN